MSRLSRLLDLLRPKSWLDRRRARQAARAVRRTLDAYDFAIAFAEARRHSPDALVRAKCAFVRDTLRAA